MVYGRCDFMTTSAQTKTGCAKYPFLGLMMTVKHQCPIYAPLPLPPITSSADASQA